MVDAPESPRPQQQTPRTSFTNGVRTTGRAFHSPNWRTKSEESPRAQSQVDDAGSPGPKTNTSRLAFSRPSPHVPHAIAEGRRLYVGNMPYTAKSEDVEALFSAEFPIERIDIAIDPFTGRNPSYCFVDLETKEMAERAMVELDGHDMLGRPVKIKPGVAKSSSERAQQQPTDGSPRRDKPSSPFSLDRWRRNDAPSFAKTNSDSSRRVYVGGLPRLTDQEAISSNMTNFFKEYNVENVSKLFTPHPAKRFEAGDHYYLFVDFSSVEEAQAAMETKNGQEGPWGANIRVQRARGETWKSEERNKWPSTKTTEISTDEVTAVYLVLSLHRSFRPSYPEGYLETTRLRNPTVSGLMILDRSQMRRGRALTESWDFPVPYVRYWPREETRKSLGFGISQNRYGFETLCCIVSPAISKIKEDILGSYHIISVLKPASSVSEKPVVGQTS